MKPLPLIISSHELHQLLAQDSEEFLILDIRSEKAFFDGHIPTAIWFDKAVVNRTVDKTSGLLPEQATLSKALDAISYRPNKPIIVYSNATAPDVGRVVWTLLAFGIKHIALLDGGISAWQANGFTLSKQATESLDANKSEIQLTSPIAEMVCNSEQLLIALKSGNSKILDVRSRAEYHGEDNRSEFAGHIPTAINFPWDEILDAHGVSLKDITTLENMFSSLGLTKEDTIYTYCQSHQRSAIIAIVLMHLGYRHVIGYPGAWSDWGNQADLPKAH